jgi:sortase B
VKKTAYRLIFLLLAAVLLVSGIQLWRRQAAEKENEERFGDISSQVCMPEPSTSPAETASQTTAEPSETTPPGWTVYEQYGDLLIENADMIGWIKIDGTTIDYPVMLTPDRPDYYLKRGFDKQPSDYGVPYVAESCVIDPQSDNVIIYSHHMKSGKMFGVLEGYKDEGFWREHPVVRFDTFSGFGTYEIIAAFKVNPNDFSYNAFVNAADEAEFDAYVRRCRELSFYDTGLTASYGDKLLTLSTCEYSEEGNRLVVVARKIDEGSEA